MVGSLWSSIRVDGTESESGVALVEHALPPQTLASPLHRHSNEDEISYVLEGQLTVQQGDDVQVLEPGESVMKRRGVWHTVWNGEYESVRFLEIISPGVFADSYREIAALLPESRTLDDIPAAELDAIYDRYGVEMRTTSVNEITSQHGLAR